VINGAPPEEVGVLGRLEQYAGPIPDAVRQPERTDLTADLGERVHPVALGFRGDPRAGVLAAEPREQSAFPSGESHRAPDLGREPAVVA